MGSALFSRAKQLANNAASEGLEIDVTRETRATAETSTNREQRSSKTGKAMDKALKESLWKQFGASIDMLENAINRCPDHLWDTEKKFWYNAYHGLFWLDYFLTLDPSTFSPPKPFTLSEFDPAGAIPERIYNKEELLGYLQKSREKCHQLILNLTDELVNQRWINEYRNYSVFEILLYNMRHVQHHAAQLNLLLRQEINDAPKWIWQTSMNL